MRPLILACGSLLGKGGEGWPLWMTASGIERCRRM
jgi:hypothetical protein